VLLRGERLGVARQRERVRGTRRIALDIDEDLDGRRLAAREVTLERDVGVAALEPGREDARVRGPPAGAA
jgi:hypothetical protein